MSKKAPQTPRYWNNPKIRIGDALIACSRRNLSYYLAHVTGLNPDTGIIQSHQNQWDWNTGTHLVDKNLQIIGRVTRISEKSLRTVKPGDQLKYVNHRYEAGVITVEATLPYSLTDTEGNVWDTKTASCQAGGVITGIHKRAPVKPAEPEKSPPTHPVPIIGSILEVLIPRNRLRNVCVRAVNVENQTLLDNCGYVWSFATGKLLSGEALGPECTILTYVQGVTVPSPPDNPVDWLTPGNHVIAQDNLGTIMTVVIKSISQGLLTDSKGCIWSTSTGTCLDGPYPSFKLSVILPSPPEGKARLSSLGPFKPGDQLSVTDLQGIPRIVIQVASVTDGCTLTDTLGNTWSRVNGACIDGPHILLHQDLTIEGVLDAKPAEKPIPPLLGCSNPYIKPATEHTPAYTCASKGIFVARYAEVLHGQFLWVLILNSAPEHPIASGKAASEAKAIKYCNQEAKRIAREMLELANL